MGSGLEQGSGPEQGSTVPEWRFLLLGKPGAGKSATGNSILGKAAFQAKFSAGPLVTRECRRERGDGPVKGRQLVVVDTPALFSPRVGAEDRRGHLQRCKELCAGGVHALLLVIPIGRFEAEDRETARRAWEAFGAETRERTVVVFTRKDELGEESELEDYIESHPDLRELVVSCGGRCCAFSNKGSAEERAGQRGALLREVQALLGDKDQPCCLQVGGPPGQLQDSEMEVAAQPRDNLQETLSLVLVGRSGTGKSATGNSILGWSRFRSELRAQPVTTTCRKGERVWGGQKVIVVDTPCLPQMLEAPGGASEVEGEVRRWLELCEDGQKVLVLVFLLGRFTQQDEKVLLALEAIFGKEVSDYVIVLFTRKEDLGDGTIEAYVRNTDNKALRDIMDKCGGRVWAFSNKETGRAGAAQVRHLLSMANGLLWERGGRGYPHPWETVSGNIRGALEKPKHSSWIPEFIYNYYVTPSSDRAEGAGGATMERQPMTQGLEEQVCLTCEAPGQARQAGVEGRGLGREGETEVRKLETPEAALGSALSPQVLVSHGDSWCQDVAGTQ